MLDFASGMEPREAAEHKARRATSNDVAKRAGVSRAAVSVVLNGTEATVRVSEATRLRILRAAAQLGYSPNPVARSLRRRRSGTIAFVFSSSSSSIYERTVPYQLGRMVMSAAVEWGYQVIELHAETRTQAGNDDVLKLLLDRRVDGVILGWPKDGEEVERIVDSGLAVVQIMKPQPAAGSSTITVDASEGMEAAVDHLFALGHERVAFLGSNDPHPVERARLDHFIEALGRRNARVPNEYVRLGTEYSLAEGYSFTRALLEHPERPTALLVVDSLILGSLRALYETRIRVPDDMSVVSYDDLLAAHLYPPLTSVVQPIGEVAQRAVALIHGYDHGYNAPDPVNIVLPTRLKVRDSTGEPRTSKP